MKWIKTSKELPFISKGHWKNGDFYSEDYYSTDPIIVWDIEKVSPKVVIMVEDKKTKERSWVSVKEGELDLIPLMIHEEWIKIDAPWVIHLGEKG